ncbi:MAG: Gfo/Idh/MocA family oxidoreductase [Candidatus Sumerlaeota bacterium]|nr:Gfo/Idh/MocA family oxidoreductase [Candidatus Sumerlaeota bacterium]
MSHPEFSFPWPATRPPIETYKTDLGIGIVGYGKIVRAAHMPAYEQAGLRVVAAADIAESARTAAKAAGIPHVFVDYHDLLASPDVQVVDLELDHSIQQVRLDVIKAAAEAKKPVLVHKPMATDLETAMAMVEAAEKGGIPLAVNQNMRYGPACYAIKGLLAPERLGRAGVLEVQNLVRIANNKPMAFNRQGQMLAWFIHHVDLIRWWADSEPTLVFARNAQGATVFTFEFASGAIATLLEITAQSVESETPLRVWAERGAARGNHRWNPWVHWPQDWVEFRSIAFPKEVGWVSLKMPGEPNPFFGRQARYDVNAPVAGFIGVMADFMQSIAEGRPAPTNARDNLLSLRMCFAAEKSAAECRPIDPRSL